MNIKNMDGDSTPDDNTFDKEPRVRVNEVNYAKQL